MKLLLGLTSLIIAITIVHSPIAQSQDFDELGLAIRPAIIEITGKAGDRLETELVIENISADAAAIEVGSRSLVPNDPEIDQNRRGDFDASQWVEAVSSSVLLDRSQIRTIPVTINIPDSAGPGGHYALITLRTVKAGQLAQENSTAAVANPELTSVLFVTVQGPTDEQATINVKNQRRVILNNPISVSASFANSGNIHLLATTEIKIKSQSDDSVIETIAIPGELVLPNTIKQLSAQWDPSGRFGQFYIEAHVSYGSPQQVETFRSEAFWVLPPTVNIVFVSALLVFTIFSIATGKHWPKAALRLAGAPLRIASDSIKNTTHDKPLDPKVLDELGADRSLRNTAKARKVKPASSAKKSTKADTAKHRDYLNKLKSKK